MINESVSGVAVLDSSHRIIGVITASDLKRLNLTPSQLHSTKFNINPLFQTCDTFSCNFFNIKRTKKIEIQHHHLSSSQTIENSLHILKTHFQQ